MAKKTWIKLKRGITEPKHRTRLGIRVWLYLEILDQVNWDTGRIEEWKDKDVAEDIEMPWRTLQDQRQQLEKDGYITCHQGFQCQNIEVHNWTNPREYSGKKYNVKKQDTEVPVQGSTGHGTGHANRKPRTPTLNSQNTDSQFINKDQLQCDCGAISCGCKDITPKMVSEF